MTSLAESQSESLPYGLHTLLIAVYSLAIYFNPLFLYTIFPLSLLSLGGMLFDLVVHMWDAKV